MAYDFKFSMEATRADGSLMTRSTHEVFGMDYPNLVEMQTLGMGTAQSLLEWAKEKAKEKAEAMK